MQDLISKAKNVAASPGSSLSMHPSHLMISNPGDIDYFGISKIHLIHASPEI